MRRLLSLSLSLPLFVVGCVADDQELEEVSTETAEIGNVPDINTWTQIASAIPGGCLDLPLGLPAGWNIYLQQYPCNTGSNQDWLVQPVGASGASQIKSLSNPSLCLDIPSYNAVPGQQIYLYNCKNNSGSYGSNQHWQFQAIDATTGVIKHPGSGLCLEVLSGVAGVSRIMLATCAAAPPAKQRWRFRSVTGSGTGSGCTGNLTIGGTVLLPGSGPVGFPVTAGTQFPVTCPSLNFRPWTIRCPLPGPFPSTIKTNYLVVDRSSGNTQYKCLTQ